MKLIVGLGNPGEDYNNTKHNIGWMILDILSENETWKTDKNAPALYLKKTIAEQETKLFKPLTFMNESGRAVAYAVKKQKININDLVVIHDDKDLPLGEYRLQKNRGSAGHNGVQSIIDHLHTKDFTRLRIGIARPDKTSMGDTAKFVLSKFNKEEKNILEKITAEIITQLKNLVTAKT